MASCDKKTCPNCGSECNIGDLYCIKCAHKFSAEDDAVDYREKVEKYTNETNYKKESPSKSSIEYDDIKQDLETTPKDNSIIKDAFGCFSLLIIIVIACIAIHFLSNKTEKQEQYVPPKALSCDNASVVEYVINIFKNENSYYKSIDKTTISSINIPHLSTTSYNDQTNEYTCIGTITMDSEPDGFRAALDETGNKYFDKTLDINLDTGEEKLLKQTKFEYKIEYVSSVNENGEAIVTTTPLDYESNGKFYCTGDCEPIIIKKAEKNNKNLESKKDVNLNNSKKPKNLYKPNNNVQYQTSNVDFGQYMKKVEKRIKRNWKPSKGADSKSAIVLFKVGKSGELISNKIKKSSGDNSFDNEALNTINKSAPFAKLPEEYSEDSIEIEFTFDYNVK